MKKFKGCLGVFLIFFFGVLFGMVIAYAGLGKKVREIVEGGPDAVVEVVVKHLKKELKLDADQQHKLQEIVVDTRIKLRQIRAQTQPRVQQTLGEAEQRVRAILYPDQVKKFEQIVKEGREKWKDKGQGVAGAALGAGRLSIQ